MQDLNITGISAIPNETNRSKSMYFEAKSHIIDIQRGSPRVNLIKDTNHDLT